MDRFSTTRIMNFTNTFSMEYFTHNEGGILKVRFTLRILSVDITSWKSQGQNGVWVGIGFGQQQMLGSDIVQCHLRFTGDVNVDKFICNDRYASAYSLPPLDTQRDTIDIKTQMNLKPANSFGTKLADFVAVFDRPCNTGDSQDQYLLTSSQNQMIWAYGPLSNDQPQVHGSTNNDRGAGQFYISPLPAIKNAKILSMIGGGGGAAILLALNLVFVF